MDFLQAHRDLITRYIQGKCSIKEFEEALALLWAAMPVDADDDAEQLSGAAGLMLAELQLGHRTEESVREELAVEMRELESRLAS
jgi:hypothetical protein